MEFAAQVLATGIVNLLQIVDVDHVVLAAADLIRRSDVYVAAVSEAILREVPRADWLTVEVTVSGLGPDVVAAGAAMEVLDERFGVPHAYPADGKVDSLRPAGECPRAADAVAGPGVEPSTPPL